MNATTNTTTRQQRRHWTGPAAIALAVALAAGPPAVAIQDTGNGGGPSTQAAPVDIDDIVTARKTAMAQDRIERSTLHR